MRLTIKDGRLYVPLGTKKAAQTSVNHENYVKMYNKLADLEDAEEELGVDLMTFISNYRELLSLKGRNLKISIEEVQKELEQFDKHN